MDCLYLPLECLFLGAVALALAVAPELFGREISLFISTSYSNSAKSGASSWVFPEDVREIADETPAFNCISTDPRLVERAVDDSTLVGLLGFGTRRDNLVFIRSRCSCDVLRVCFVFVYWTI